MKKNLRRALNAALLLVLITIWTPLLGRSAPLESHTSSAPNINWDMGDIFVTDVKGQYKVFSNSGAYKQTISSGLGGNTTGCAFDKNGDLYTTDWDNTKVVKYSGVPPHDKLLVIDTALQDGRNSESIVVAPGGGLYIGHANFFGYGNGAIQRYNEAGGFQQIYHIMLGPNRTDWIDLSADQHTLFFTSEDRNIRRYDILGGGVQLEDFATLPGIPGTSARAIRLLPPGNGSGGLLVADILDVKRLDGSGNVIKTYDAPGEDNWEGMSLDPSGTSFWSGDLTTGHFYKFNIDTGAVEVGPISTTRVAGICVKGERTASHLAPIASVPAKPISTTTNASVFVIYIVGSVVLLGGLVGLGYYLLKAHAN